MLQFITLLAHAEELHDEETSSAVHLLTSTPIALILYVLGLLGLWQLSKLAKEPPKVLIISSLVYNFALGVIGYVFVPWVAVIAITLGILTALFFSLGAIAGGN